MNIGMKLVRVKITASNVQNPAALGNFEELPFISTLSLAGIRQANIQMKSPFLSWKKKTHHNITHNFGTDHSSKALLISSQILWCHGSVRPGKLGTSIRTFLFCYTYVWLFIYLLSLIYDLHKLPCSSLIIISLKRFFMAILRPLHDTILKTTHALYILKLCYNTKLLFMSSLEIHP